MNYKDPNSKQVDSDEDDEFADRLAGFGKKNGNFSQLNMGGGLEGAFGKLQQLAAQQ